MIKINNIYKAYGNEALYENFSLDIEENKITCILGRSGVGKTTLINMLCGIAKQDKGEIILPENCRFSYVFQEPRLLEWYSVYDNIDLVLKNDYNATERKEIINEFLELVELKDFSNYKINKLSGGMAQRVSLARAFAYPSDILILDEPFNGLDINLEEDLISRFKKLWLKDKKTVIFVTHNVEQAISLSDYINILSNKPVGLAKTFTRSQFNSNTRMDIKALLI